MPEFNRQSQLCMDEESKNSFKNFIAQHPLSGTLIVGTGGIRKIRWSVNDHQGKSSGV